MQLTNTYTNVEPVKVMKHVSIISNGELLEGDVETDESRRARLGWSKTAGENVGRSLELWKFERRRQIAAYVAYVEALAIKVNACDQCGVQSDLTHYRREHSFSLWLCGPCLGGAENQ